MYFLFFSCLGIGAPSWLLCSLFFEVVCVVKVVIIVGPPRIDASASVADQTWIIGRVAFDLDSDKFQSFNHREELNSAAQLPNFRLVQWHAAHGVRYIYIAQGSLCISTRLRHMYIILSVHSMPVPQYTVVYWRNLIQQSGQ